MSRARILQPYTRRVDDTRHRASRVAVIGGLVLLAMLLGFIIAILPLRLLLVPMAPILLLAGVALWMAPDSEANYDATIRKLLLWLIGFAMVWPDYIAFTMPGIGWLSPQRLLMGLLFFVGLFALATSSGTRSHVKDVISHSPAVYWSFMAYFVLQLVLAFAWGELSSRFFFAQIFWYYMFVLAAWTFCQPNTARRLYQLMLIGLAVQCIYGYYEMRNGVPLWSGRIPSFLQVDPELLEKVLGYRPRAGTDKIRIASIYMTPITFAEFIAMSVPFAMLAMIRARKFWWRIAAAGLLVFAFMNGLWTDSRSAMVGFVIASVSMVGLWAWQRFRRLKAQRDIWAPAVIWAYPAGLMLVMSAILFVGRVRVAVLGGGQHANSNIAREAQWDKTFELLAKNPIGYGPFTAAERVNYTNRAGTLTIDGYMMNVLVDTGILGWILFIFFFLACAALGVRTFVNSANDEEDLGGPLAVALVSFLFVKMVLSQTENHYIAYMLAGCAVALHWRQQQRLKADARAPATAVPEPPPLGGPRPAGTMIPVGGYGVAASR